MRQPPFRQGLLLALVTLGVLWPITDLAGQDPTSRRRRPLRGSQEDLIARKQAALEKPFLQNAKWHTDLATAKRQGALRGKPIFAYFSRSYSP